MDLAVPWNPYTTVEDILQVFSGSEIFKYVMRSGKTHHMSHKLILQKSKN